MTSPDHHGSDVGTSVGTRSEPLGPSERTPLEPYLYYESPRGPVAGARRILLVSHAFPPDPEVGGLRWQQMARFFGEHGWTFDVLTRDFRTSSHLDPARLELLPAGTRVFCVPAATPLMLQAHRRIIAAWRGIRRRSETATDGTEKSTGTATASAPVKHHVVIRTYFALIAFMRDAKWADAVARAGVRLAAGTNYCVVVSSGPPHMAHAGARRVARSSRLAHVVDMRDPWSLVQRLPAEFASPIWFVLARHFERRVVRTAALVVMNTERSRDAMRAAYPDHARKTDVVRNGCDDELLPPAPQRPRFSIRFAGSIYIDRDPRLVFRAAARVIGELGLQPSQFAIEFVGNVDRFAGTPTMQIAHEEGIERYVTVGGMMKRQAALEFLAGGSILLSLPQDSDFAIPAKIYEYLRFDAWLLILAHKDSATAQLLRDVDADVLEPDDLQGITSAIRRRYDQFCRGDLPRALGSDGRFDRRVQAMKLMELIDGVVTGDCTAASRNDASSPSLRS